LISSKDFSSSSLGVNIKAISIGKMHLIRVANTMLCVVSCGLRLFLGILKAQHRNILPKHFADCCYVNLVKAVKFRLDSVPSLRHIELSETKRSRLVFEQGQLRMKFPLQSQVL
jgi:hypothetical protein